VQVENALDALRAMGWVQEEQELEYLVIPAGKYMTMKEVRHGAGARCRAALVRAGRPPAGDDGGRLWERPAPGAAPSSRPAPRRLPATPPASPLTPAAAQVRCIEDAKDRLKKAMKEEARNK
jgi:hypothetical protein